jgi:Arc/MetJ-type ribon-helix-helix transcriptional regulator
MAQINFHTTPQFDADLAVMTAALKLKSKSEAIRFAVHQVAEALRERAARARAGGT